MGQPDGVSGVRWGGGGPGVALTGDEVVVVDGGEVRALDAVSGEVRWSRTVGAGFRRITVAGDLRIVVGEPGVVALDRTGGERWRVANSPWLGGAALHAGRGADEVVVVSDDRVAVAYSAASGAERWRRSVQVPFGLPAPVVEVRRGDEQVVLLADEAGLHVIDPVLGTDVAVSATIVASTAPAEAAFRVPPTVLVGRDEVYRIDGATVAAYDLLTLAPRWSTSLGSVSQGAGARSDGGGPGFTRLAIVRVTCAGSTFAFHLSDGSVRLARASGKDTVRR